MSLYRYYEVDEEKSRDGAWVKVSFGGQVRIRRQNDPKVTAVILEIQRELGTVDIPDPFSLEATEETRHTALVEMCARGVVTEWDEKHTGPDDEPMECSAENIRQVANDIDEWMLEVLRESQRRVHYRPDSGNSRASRRGKHNGRVAKPTSRFSKGAVTAASARPS